LFILFYILCVSVIDRCHGRKPDRVVDNRGSSGAETKRTQTE